MTASRALRKGDRVLTVDWVETQFTGSVLRAIRRNQPGVRVRTVLATEPIPSDGYNYARTLVLFTDRTHARPLTGSDWLMED